MTDKKTPTPSKSSTKKARSFTLADDTVDLLSQLAKMENRSRSNMIELLVDKEAKEKGLVSDNINKN